MKKFHLESYEERKLIDLYRAADQRGKRAIFQNALIEAEFIEIQKKEDQEHDSRKI
jgi:proline dehydrogenase